MVIAVDLGEREAAFLKFCKERRLDVENVACAAIVEFLIAQGEITPVSYDELWEQVFQPETNLRVL